MIEISPDFTLDDIRRLRNDFYYRHQDMDFAAMTAEIEAGAESAAKEIEKMRQNRTRTTDVVVTRRGKKLGRIVCDETAVNADRISAFNELMALAADSSSVPDDTVYDTVKEERLRAKGLLK